MFSIHRLPAWGDQTIEQVIPDQITLQYLAEFVRSIGEDTPLIGN